jgi:Beta-L-arabinofuranosidase, GH127
MNEVLTNLFQVTGNPDHLATAQRFDHDVIFDPLASRQDQLNNHRANTRIPKIIGAVRDSSRPRPSATSTSRRSSGTSPHGTDLMLRPA